MAGPVTTYDFTSFAEAEYTEIIQHLKEVCREWVFQKEQCPTTGTFHFQGRVHLRRKMRLPQAVNELACGPLQGAHLSPTSTANMGNAFYVTKVESRVAGPWDSKAEEVSSKDIRRAGWDKRAKYLEQAGLYPWQQRIVDLCREPDDRSIYVVVDEKGGIGKSSLVKYLRYKNLAIEIPSMFKEGRDVMRMVMAQQGKAEALGINAYVIDIPRSVPQSALTGIWGAVECVKNGHVYDDRYSYREADFPEPAVFVFCNKLPPPGTFSEDRIIQIQI